jgi:HK97 family phage portal protein
MGFLDKILKAWTGSTDSKLLQVQHNTHSLPDFTPNDFRNFVNEGFAGNDLIYTGLTLRAQSFIEADLAIKNEDNELLEGDPRLAVFLNPNKYMTGKEFMKMIVHHLDLDGNAFILKGKSGKGRVQELHLLRPDRVAVVVSKKPGELIASYIYKLDGKETRIKPDEMLHIKTSNPWKPQRGISPMQPILQHVDIDNESRNFTKSLLENKGAPGGFLKIMGNITKAAKEKLVASFKQKFGGNNRGTVGILDADVEYINTAMNLQELDFSHITQFTESRILATLGINPVIVGAMSGQSGSTFNNVAEAKLSFYQQTIIPLQRLVADAFNNDEDLNFGNVVKFFFDTSDVSALAILKDQKIVSLENAVGSWITVNEMRAIQGLEAIEGGDELNISQEPPAFNEAPQEVPDKNPAPEDKNPPPKEKAAKPTAKKQLEIETEWAGVVRKTAERGYDKTELWATALFAEMFEDIASAISRSEKAKHTDALNKFEKELEKFQDTWRSRIAQDTTFPLAKIASDMMQTQSPEVGLTFRVTSEHVTQAMNEYSFKFADKISTTASKTVKKIFLQGREAGASLEEIRQGLHEAFKGRVSENWAKMVARTETMRAANEGTLAAYKAAGVKTTRWVAAGDACPYCAGLDGKTVVTGEAFAETGYQPNAKTAPLDLNYNGGFAEVPPIHPHCGCIIIDGSI